MRENLLTTEQMDILGIMPASVIASLRRDRKGWVAEHDGRIVAFAIADGATSSIFALFVLPEYEDIGLGRALLGRAVQFLWDHGAELLWLTTAPGTRAARFYARAGWEQVAGEQYGELRFELRRPG